MRTAIAWSHDLLAPEEQRLFRDLSPFVGGFSLEAAEAVATGSLDPPAVLEGVAALVDQSLLYSAAGPDDEPRFVMLETVREYGLERLTASGDETAVLEAHADRSLSLVEHATTRLLGPEQGRWLTRLEVEHDNLRASLAWVIERGNSELALRLSSGLWLFWFLRGNLSEGREWLRRAMALPAEVPTRARAEAAVGAGTITATQGDHTAGMTLLEEGVALMNRLGDRIGEAWAAGMVGNAAALQGDHDRAAAHYLEVLAVLPATGPYGAFAALALGNLGQIEVTRGARDRAAALYEEALRRQRDIGNPMGVITCLVYLADLVADEGDHPRAIALYREGIDLLRGLDHLWFLGAFLTGIASVAVAVGQVELAIRLLAASQAAFHQFGVPPYPGFQLRRQRILDAVRTDSDEASYATEWAAGRSLSLEQAVALASTFEAPPAAGRASVGRPPPRPRTRTSAATAALRAAGSSSGQ